MKTPCFGTHLRERLFDSLCAYPGGLFMANWKKDPWPDSKPDHFFTYQSGQNSGFEGLQPPCPPGNPPPFPASCPPKPCPPPDLFPACPQPFPPCDSCPPQPFPPAEPPCSPPHQDSFPSCSCPQPFPPCDPCPPAPWPPAPTGVTAPSIYAQQGKCRNHAAFSTLKTIKHPL